MRSERYKPVQFRQYSNLRPKSQEIPISDQTVRRLFYNIF